MSDLRFGDDRENGIAGGPDNVEIELHGIRCSTKFENCQAVKQKRMSENDEMMFGIFGEEPSQKRNEISPEIAALNARLILPKTSDEYVSHIEIRNYQIPPNPLFQEIFSCSPDEIKLSQKEKNEVYLHVNLKKEQQTPRSAIFEAIALLLEELSLKRKIENINKLCLPFIHFGKVRIATKVDETNGNLRIEMFNLFGSLFGFLNVFDEDPRVDNEDDNFMTEAMLKNKFTSIVTDSDEDSGKESDEKQNSIVMKTDSQSSTLQLLVSVLQNQMNLLKSLQDDVSTTPLPYLGIDSLRLAELEYHIMNTQEFKDFHFKAPFLIPYKTLSQIATFLEMMISKTHDVSEVKTSEVLEDSSKSMFRIPLSSQQKRILFVKEMEKEHLEVRGASSQFNEVVILEFSKLDEDLVSRTLNYLILVHSVFRSQYTEDFQYLLSGTECFVAIRDKDQTHVRDSSLFGIKCIQEQPLKLKIIFDHISIDGRSLSIFYSQFKELLSLPSSSFSKQSLQYFDYCRAKSQTTPDSHDYWKRYLNLDQIELEKIPSDFSNDADIFMASYIHRTFPIRLQSKFNYICQLTSFSRFELFLGLLEVSIRRIFGISGTFSIGFAVDQRTFPYFETIGCFTNVLLYLSSQSSSDRLMNQLKTCQATLQKCRFHGDISYESIVNISGIKDDVFQIFVVSDVVDMEVKQSKKKRVRFEDEAIHVKIVQDINEEKKISKYPMTWYLRQFGNDQIHVEVEYAQELFRKETIESILEEMFRIINSFHCKTEERGSENDLNPDVFLQKTSFPLRKRSDFSSSTVSQIINSLGFKVRHLQKDHKLYSGPFSTFLQKTHIQLYCQLLTEHPVILKMHRSPDLILSVLGSWQAGFYPVPLHKDVEEDQIQKTCQGLGLKVGEALILKDIEKFKRNKPNFESGRVFNRSSLFDLAYVTATSGSTGTPKLVGTSFEGHSNLAKQYTNSFQISSKDTIGQVVDPSFDIFFADIVKTFTNEALLLLARDSIPTPFELLECTNVYLMPAFLSRLPDMRCLTNLEILQYGGEPLAPQVLQLLHRNNENLKVYQEFGLTEQTVYSSRRRILWSQHDSEEMRIIGEPYDNIHFKLKAFTDSSHPVMRGQLILKGVGLMRGYFGVNKEQLKEFPTGDEVSKRRNGDIVFIGRKDSQVKVRGHRVDLFEIECIALSSNIIESCTCIAVENKQLVLFFNVKSSENIQSSETTLKVYMEEKLISYKVPSKLISLDRFPLTRTGKIDKRKLEEMFRERDIKTAMSSSQNPKLKLIVESKNPKTRDTISSLLLKWLQYYSKSTIQLTDEDIFASGVDSIAVMLTMQKLRSEGIEIPVKLFFKAKTIRRIVDLLLTTPESTEKTMAISMAFPDRNKKPPTYFINLNHIQQRILFLSRMITSKSDPFLLQFSLSIRQNNLVDLSDAVNLVTVGNQMLRSKLQRIQGEYRFILLSGTECYRSPHVGLFESTNVDPFMTRIWLNQEKSRLFISIHHIICDGKSLQILEEQIETIFQSGSKCIKFQNFFVDKTVYIADTSPQLFMGLQNWISCFPSFKIGSKSAKQKFAVSLNNDKDTAPITFQIGFAYSKAISDVFQISNTFPIATTFANRTDENWNTVSMFANTLPLMCHPDQSLEEFSEKFYELTENSNIPLNEILKNRPSGNGNFADFALNFHRRIEEKDNLYEVSCQFPMVLTFSEIDKLAQIEYDEDMISMELAEKVKTEITKTLGCGEEKREEVDYVEVFRKFLKNSSLSGETDFFLSGGHSLIAMQMIDYLSDSLEIEIPLKLIFEFRTPKTLENAVNQLRRGEVPLLENVEKEKHVDDKTALKDNKQIKCQHLPVNSDENALLSESKDFKFPLSRQQNQMFYVSQLTENSLEYQLPFIQPFPSTVTSSEIHRSLLMTIQEQNIFRAVFLMDSETGEPYQMVVSMTESFIRCHVEIVQNEQDLHRRIQELCEDPIDVLGGTPLLRATFVSSPNKHVAFLHLHHLISDAKSTQLTNSTMKTFFEKPEQTPKRPRFTYMDYCRLEKSDHSGKIDSGYLKTLADGLGNTKFLENKKSNSQKASIDIPREAISNKLLTSGDTPFSIFLKLIYSSLIRFSTNVSNFNIAFPVLNRNEKTSNICGYFLNNLVINSSQLPTLSSILSVNLPYADVIREVRNISGRDQLVAEVYINCRYDLEFDESDDEVLMDLVPLKLHFPIEFDIDLLRGETYRITMRSDKFTKQEMLKILMGLKNELAVTDTSRTSPQTLESILFGSKKDIPNFSIPELLRNFFNSNYSSTFAISNKSWSYGQTHRKLLKYSWKLHRDFLSSRASPIRSDDIIGIIGTKSVETIIRCLAVQFSGAAYLPIDAGYPEGKKKEILKDARFIFGEFEPDEDSILPPNHCRHFSISTPFCLSYIITTSGTTGHPKSVAIGADSLSNLCLSSTRTMRSSSASRIFQFTNFVFDNSVLEVSMAIASQATLVYGSSNFDPSELEKSIEYSGITHCLLFPSLVQSFDISKIKNLPYWIVGGERLPQALLDSALNLGICVIQNYGPTETTAFAVAKQMKNGDIGCEIGYPAFNSKVRILKQNDDNSGELLISGTGIMRGYLNKEHYFKVFDGKTWYPSGDICRIKNESEVEFIGRTDSQIKIRGYRVELSEIERTIESYWGVIKCIAIFEHESQQIHIFYTGNGQNLNSNDIRRHCESLLEPQKIPSTFNQIDEFPLTSNSKIDKAILMEIMRSPSKPPQTNKLCPIESELSSVWMHLLNCQKPSPFDHFFLIGGHSLLLIRLRHLIQIKLEVQLSVPEILENLKFGDMLQLLRLKKEATNKSNKTLIFFPALYGGCTAYLKLISMLRSQNEKLNIVLLDEETGDTVSEVASRYKKQIVEKLNNSSDSFIFIGASSAGTFAHSTCQLFEKTLTIILLDSGTFWNLIDNLDFSKHEKEMIENLKNFEVDQPTAQQMAKSSWNTLQVLKRYQPKITHRGKIYVLSVDGTDLGWSQYSTNLKVHKINGDHYSMLQDPNHVLEIVKVIEEILQN